MVEIDTNSKVRPFKFRQRLCFKMKRLQLKVLIRILFWCRSCCRFFFFIFTILKFIRLLLIVFGDPVADDWLSWPHHTSCSRTALALRRSSAVRRCISALRSRAVSVLCFNHSTWGREQLFGPVEIGRRKNKKCKLFSRDANEFTALFGNERYKT